MSKTYVEVSPGVLVLQTEAPQGAPTPGPVSSCGCKTSVEVEKATVRRARFLTAEDLRVRASEPLLAVAEPGAKPGAKRTMLAVCEGAGCGEHPSPGTPRSITFDR